MKLKISSKFNNINKSNKFDFSQIDINKKEFQKSQSEKDKKMSQNLNHLQVEVELLKNITIEKNGY